MPMPRFKPVRYIVERKYGHYSYHDLAHALNLTLSTVRGRFKISQRALANFEDVVSFIANHSHHVDAIPYFAAIDAELGPLEAVPRKSRTDAASERIEELLAVDKELSSWLGEQDRAQRSGRGNPPGREATRSPVPEAIRLKIKFPPGPG